MKQLWMRIGMILMVLAFLLCAAGCQQTSSGEESTTPTTQPTTPPTTETTVPEPTEDPQVTIAALYDSAVDAIYDDSLRLNITYNRTTVVSSQTYKEDGTIRLDYWDLGTDNMLAEVQQSTFYGGSKYDFSLTELYSAGKVYQTLKKNTFYAEIDAEDYSARYVPVKMLDPSLYTLSIDEAGTCITFAEATAGESWLVPEDAQVTATTATAELDASGKLTKTCYTVTYTYGPAEITVDYQVTVGEAGNQPTVPADTADYVLLDQIDAVYAIEHAYGYLCQVKHVSSSDHTMTASAAAGFVSQESLTVDTYVVGDTYAMKGDGSYRYEDYSSGQSQSTEYEEKFIDGVYTMSQDGGRAEPNSAVNQGLIESYITNHLIANFMENSYVASVETTDTGDALLFEFTGTEELGEAFCADICTTLFNDSSLLNKLASSYETKKMTFYLALDKYAMLPTAIGYQYEGAHVIEGHEYLLSQQSDQSIDLVARSTYDTIYEKIEPETEPENKATPLFYKVTGANGQKMWLFGTIHVGDERTGFLPEEIYEAFRESDALAIECNIEEFYDQLEDDEELSAAVSACYYYSDGSTIDTHLVTEDLHESAVKALKAAGGYHANAEYQMPYVWGSSIDSFHRQLGSTLVSEKGVEERLMALAEEENKPIREVESTLFQMQMSANYSEHLQEFLLYSSIASSAQSYGEGVMELYELWCAGDEAALIEEIASEPWEILEEDIKLEDLDEEDLAKAQAILADLDNINAQLKVLQEEYDKAMSFDRNEGMLEVAKEYLESGDVIFYAVGLAHLLEENGLVNTLRQAGYTVELVSYS